jgi:hypothetical protein
MTINGKYVRNAFGSTIAAPTWQRFMRQAHEGLPVAGFSQASSSEIEGQRVRVPNVVGRSQGDAQAILRRAGFTVRTAPEQAASSVPAGSVASTSPAAGASTSRGGVVTLTLSNG